jgi:hypothetical protein
MERASEAPGHAMHAAARATAAEQDAAQTASFEERLRLTGVPEPVVRRVMASLRSAGGATWADPSQELVAPGRIYYVRQLPPEPPPTPPPQFEELASSKAGGGSGGGAADVRGEPAGGGGAGAGVGVSGGGRATLITVDATRRYTVQRISPSELRRMIVSESMVTDHTVTQYRRGILAVRRG